MTGGGTEIFVGDDALELLGAFVARRGWSRTLVVMDANTEEVSGARVVATLTSKLNRVSALSFPERSGLLASESNVGRVEEDLLGTEGDSLVSVGSGVLTDITRYVASRSAREFISVPTAASQDGYASSVAAMEFRGIKKTFPAVAPVAIFAEPSTIAAAPLAMTRSGLGDLFGKATSRVDWLAAHGLWGEVFYPDVADRITGALVAAAKNVEAILMRSPESITSLLRGLIDSGVAMAIVGNSRPASGAEHHVSHFFDRLAAQRLRPHAPHGLQVGYATHFVMALQRFAFGGEVTEIEVPAESDSGDEERTWFDGHADDLRGVLDEKRRFRADHMAAWPATPFAWHAVNAQLAGVLEIFPLVERALFAAGIPATPGFLDVDAMMLRAALRYANRLRARYTVLDFLEGQGLLDTAIEEVLSGRQ